MKEIVSKYVLIFLIVLTLVIPGGILLSGLAGCARVSYKKHTPSTICNVMIMMLQLKSIKGMSAFEVGRLEKCYEDLEKIEKKDKTK